MPAIGVFCGSSGTLDRRWLELARQVGTELGRRGHTLVSGGGCVGMMGAVTAAARAAGGHTVGVIPQFLIDLEVADRDSDELLVTTGMADRKTVIMDRCAAFLVLPGGIGTLDELFEVWTTLTLGLHAKPVVLLDTQGFYAGLRAWLRTLVPARFVRAEALDLLTVVDSVPAAFDAVEKGIA